MQCSTGSHIWRHLSYEHHEDISLKERRTPESCLWPSLNWIKFAFSVKKENVLNPLIHHELFYQLILSNCSKCHAIRLHNIMHSKLRKILLIWKKLYALYLPFTEVSCNAFRETKMCLVFWVGLVGWLGWVLEIFGGAFFGVPPFLPVTWYHFALFIWILCHCLSCDLDPGKF